ncbi:V-set and immunoglobulin domain-containing protein 1 [Pelodytes ibericus]
MLQLFVKIILLTWSLTVSVNSVEVTIPNPVVNVTAGQNATLYCAYTPAGPITNTLFIQWSFVEANSQETNFHSPCFTLEESSVNQCQKMVVGRDARGRCSWKNQVYYFQNGQPHVVGNFKNRVTAANSSGNASITISNLQPQDTGIYTCEVLNPPAPVGQGTVRLIVQVAPSTPHCSMRGAMETGHYLSLQCFSEEGMPRPIYTWNKVVDGVVKPIPTQLNQQKGMLIIGNMTNFDDGYYRCTASNYLGNASCQLDLHTGGHGGIIIGGIIGAILLAAVIFAIIWVLLVKNKKKNQKGAANEKKTSSGGNTYEGVPEKVHEPAGQNLVASEPAETIEFHDQPPASNGETENPSV